MHACSFEAGLHHECVRTLSHAVAHRPSVSPILRIRHERFACEERAELFADGFSFTTFGRECFQDTQQPLRTPMCEDRPTAFQHISRQGNPSVPSRLNQRIQVFSSMRNIEHAHGVRSMQIDTSLEPLRSIRHGADGLSLVNPPSLAFCLCHIPKG